MISDTELFGLTRAERAAEDAAEAQRMYVGPLRAEAAVRTDAEAAEYTQEIMEAIGAEQCAICGRWYLPVDDCPLCDNCLSYENQAWTDYCDEVASAMAATNGTL